MVKKNKVLLVNDFVISQKGLKLLIEKDDNLIVIGEAIGKSQLFSLLKSIEPDIIIINLSLPEVSLNSICKNIHLLYPHIPLMLLLDSTIEISIPETIVNGVRGIIWKENSNDELIEAIHKVANGGLFFENPDNCRFNCRLSHKLQKVQDMKQTESVLSIREIEVLKLFAEGLSYKEIADLLNISPRTVETHKVNIQSKLNLCSKTDIIRYALENDILS